MRGRGQCGAHAAKSSRQSEAARRSGRTVTLKVKYFDLHQPHGDGRASIPGNHLRNDADERPKQQGCASQRLNSKTLAPLFCRRRISAEIEDAA